MQTFIMSLNIDSTRCKMCMLEIYDVWGLVQLNFIYKSEEGLFSKHDGLPFFQVLLKHTQSVTQQLACNYSC